MWYIFNLIERLTDSGNLLDDIRKGLERLTRVQSAGY